MLKRIGIGILMGTATVLSANAANPASTDYVNKAFALIQQQIDAIQRNPKNTLKLGQSYGGGTIIYLDNSKIPYRGLIAAPTDVISVPICGSSGDLCFWDTDSHESIPQAKGILIFDGGPLGNNNTQDILTAIGNTRAQAAFAATSYTSAGDETCTTTTISCTEWYLPSVNELSLLYVFGGLLGEGVLTGFTTSGYPYYWSSTQTTSPDDTDAWDMAFDATGTHGLTGKSTAVRVRAVRAFTY